MKIIRRFAMLALPLLLVGCATNTISFYWENDALSYRPNKDANYTNGLQLSITPKDPYQPCDNHGSVSSKTPCIVNNKAKKVINWLNFLHDDSSAAQVEPKSYPIRLEYGLGQQAYTPEDISISEIQDQDRPYGGWSFAHLKIHNDRVLKGDHKSSWEKDRRLTVATKLGVVGPSSGAGAVQRWWHEQKNDNTPSGWDHQIRNEPGFVVAAAREDRLWTEKFGSSWRADAIWRGELSVGNVYTGANLGGTVRFGYNLPRSFSPITISEQMLDAGRAYKTSAMNSRNPFSFYGFAGVVGSVVVRDIFLDGGIFRKSPHTIDSKPLHAESQIGLGVEYGCLALRVLFAHRSRQFKTQEEAHSFASVVITSRFQ